MVLIYNPLCESALDDLLDLLQQQELHDGKRGLTGDGGDKDLVHGHGAFNAHSLHHAVQGASVKGMDFSTIFMFITRVFTTSIGLDAIDTSTPVPQLATTWTVSLSRVSLI